MIVLYGRATYAKVLKEQKVVKKHARCFYYGGRSTPGFENWKGCCWHEIGCLCECSPKHTLRLSVEWKGHRRGGDTGPAEDNRPTVSRSWEIDREDALIPSPRDHSFTD